MPHSDLEVPATFRQKVFEREGNGVGFDRVVFFSDAVFAIALTLMAVEIGVPEITDSGSVNELWEALIEKLPLMAAFLTSFIWVAIYWKANHQFTNSLQRMTSRYIRYVLIYLGLVAFLPFPAALLGEYWSNPLAVSVFAVYAAMLSLMEVVLFEVAYRDKMFVDEVSPEYRKWSILGSLTPIPSFLIAIPVAFVSTLAGIACFFVFAVFFGFLITKFAPFDRRDFS